MWMKHAEHDGIADLPDLPFWRAQGWEPTDGPPPEPDTLRDPGVEPPTEEDPETPPDAGSFAVQPDEADDDEEMTRG
jgi:hypothetical protein